MQENSNLRCIHLAIKYIRIYPYIKLHITKRKQARKKRLHCFATLTIRSTEKNTLCSKLKLKHEKCIKAHLYLNKATPNRTNTHTHTRFCIVNTIGIGLLWRACERFLLFLFFRYFALFRYGRIYVILFFCCEKKPTD